MAHLVGYTMRRVVCDPFPLFQNGFVASEVDVGGCDVAQALLEALVIVMIYKRLDLGFKIAGREVVFQLL